MAPIVLGAIELSYASWVCTYDPNSAFQYFLTSSLIPVIMVLGLTIPL